MAKHDAAPEDELTRADVVEPDDSADDALNAGTASDEQLADDDGEAEDTDYDAESDTASVGTRWLSPARMAMLASLAIVVVAAALVGVLGFRTYQSEQAKNRDELFVAAARQGAINLTTIDWQEADADINRILDSATGTFYDDFSKRSQPFVEVVKQAQSKSVGTVSEAGLESESGDQAQVLVAVEVKTTNIGAQEQRPRAWRMRIDVQRLGDQAKVSNVQFVP
jgi:Mce-associated membrane protein